MITAQILSQKLGGRWFGNYGAAPCPVCQSERKIGQNALTISDGDSHLLIHCKKLGCNFRDIIAAAGITSGSWKSTNPTEVLQGKVLAKKEASKRSQQARLLWSEALPITGTVAERYLRKRHIDCILPDTLRFHPNCWHHSAKYLPAMIALIDGVEDFALHRTYLLPDGSGKAQVDQPKAMLGNVSGGAVRLVKEPGPLVVAEGIETALSLSCGILNGPATIWAALSTSGFKSLRLPRNPEKLTIAADNDHAGHKAAYELATTAVLNGWEVSLLTPPLGLDWNDVLQGSL
jgi:hypothetical protein